MASRCTHMRITRFNLIVQPPMLRLREVKDHVVSCLFLEVRRKLPVDHLGARACLLFRGSPLFGAFALGGFTVY